MPTFERLPRPEKVAVVDDMSEVLKCSAVILTDYQGLDIKSLMSLRKKLRDANGGYRIVKNTLLRRAAKGTAAEQMAEETTGPTAVLYCDDPVAAAKTLQDFVKGAKAVVVKAGIVEGVAVTPDQIAELSKIPPREQLYAMVVGGLQSPISGLAGTLQQLLGQLVFTLQGVADQKAA